MDSPYGKLEITINLSKPEKDARKILAEKKMSQKISSVYVMYGE